MAYKITTKPNTHPVDATYPYGDIKDNTGSNDGTPVNRLVYADFHQFFAKMAAYAGVTLNDLPDNEVNGYQFFEALLRTIAVRRKVINIGVWDMDATASITIEPAITGLDETTVRSFHAFIVNDAGTAIYNLCHGNSVTSLPGNILAGVNMSGDFIFTLSRAAASLYDSTSFNDGAMNRGYIIVEYEV